MRKNFLILGGSGFVGRSLCEALTERYGTVGVRITVPSRRPQRAKHLLTLPTIDLVEADVHDPSQLLRLVAGRDAVINLVAILHGSEAEFDRVHHRLADQIACSCVATEVRRVLHVSALGIGADAPSHYLRSKAAGEAVLRAAGLDLTLLRPSVIFGARDRFTNLFARLQAFAPVLPLASADARFQPVWVEDVVSALLRCLDDDRSIGQTYECAGPTVYTLADLARLTGRLSGRERPVLPLPEALGRAQATLMGLLPGEPLMSVDNLDSMKRDNVASGTLPDLRALGIVPAALEAVAPRYLGAGQGPARLDAWRAQARRH